MRLWVVAEHDVLTAPLSPTLERGIGERRVRYLCTAVVCGVPVTWVDRVSQATFFTSVEDAVAWVLILDKDVGPLCQVEELAAEHVEVLVERGLVRLG